MNKFVNVKLFFQIATFKLIIYKPKFNNNFMFFKLNNWTIICRDTGRIYLGIGRSLSRKMCDEVVECFVAFILFDSVGNVLIIFSGKGVVWYVVVLLLVKIDSVSLMLTSLKHSRSKSGKHKILNCVLLTPMNSSAT